MRTAEILGVLLVASVALSGCYDRHGRPGYPSDRHHHGHHHGDRDHDRDRDWRG